MGVPVPAYGYIVVSAMRLRFTNGSALQIYADYLDFKYE
jgi:hypothetical protein